MSGTLPPPLLTCEPVLTEACFLIHRHGGVIEVAMEIGTEAPALEALLRYRRSALDISFSRRNTWRTWPPTLNHRWIASGRSTALCSERSMR